MALVRRDPHWRTIQKSSSEPAISAPVIHVEDRNDPATRSLPETWERTDEWYSFENNSRARGFHVLATVDEHTYQPKMLWKDVSMGADHPLIWKHCVGKGRVFYSALGPSAGTYQEPLHLALLEGAIAWAAGLEGQGCQISETPK